MTATPTPEIEVKEHPNFRTISVGGGYSTQNGMQFEIMVYSEHVDLSKILASVQQSVPTKFIRTMECRLILDPIRVKLITQTLTAQLNAFEKQYGQIPTSEEREQTGSPQEVGGEKTTGVA